MSKHMIVALKKGAVREDVLDTLEGTVVKYMANTRSLDEAGIRKLLLADPEVRASYLRKIERLVQCLILDGVPAAFFGRKA